MSVQSQQDKNKNKQKQKKQGKWSHALYIPRTVEYKRK
jgi:hypothetical protein